MPLWLLFEVRHAALMEIIMRIYPRFRYRVIDHLRGTRSLEMFQFLLQSQWWTAEQIKNLQTRKMCRLITTAYNNVPYYKAIMNERGLSPDDFWSLTDLRKLPVLTKDTIRESPEAFVNRYAKRVGFHRKSTSGSTGDIFTYYLSHAAYNYYGFIWRSWCIAGYNLGDKVILLTGGPLTSQKWDIAHTVFHWLNNWVRLSAFDMTLQSMDGYLNVIESSGARFVYGYASAMHELACYAKSAGRGIDLESVVTTAEVLQPEYRQVIQDVFTCEVFDQYGVNDGGAGAFECERHRLHQNAERAVVEIVDADGEPVKVGEVGRIITTDLDNLAFPFLRYDTGDLGVWGDRCSCGRFLPVIDRIIGRSSDFVVTPGGTNIHGEYFSHVFRNVDFVRKFRVVQSDSNKIKVYIVNQRDPTLSERVFVEKALERRLGDMKIDLKYVVDIPRSLGGKHRLVVNEIKGGKSNCHID